jgi:hypothetical protein
MKRNDPGMYDRSYINNNFEPSDEEDEVNINLGLIKTQDKDGLMRPLVVEFEDDSGVDEMVCNNRDLSHRTSGVSIDLKLRQTFRIMFNLIDVIKW